MSRALDLIYSERYNKMLEPNHFQAKYMYTRDVCKVLYPKHLLVPNRSCLSRSNSFWFQCQNCKEHNSVKILRNSPKRWSVIYTSSQISLFDSNNITFNFRDILLIRLQCHKLQRTITPIKFHGICPKVNQVIYISSPISKPNTKALP